MRASDLEGRFASALLSRPVMGLGMRLRFHFFHLSITQSFVFPATL